MAVVTEKHSTLARRRREAEQKTFERYEAARAQRKREAAEAAIVEHEEREKTIIAAKVGQRKALQRLRQASANIHERIANMQEAHEHTLQQRANALLNLKESIDAARQVRRKHAPFPHTTGRHDWWEYASFPHAIGPAGAGGGFQADESVAQVGECKHAGGVVKEQKQKRVKRVDEYVVRMYRPVRKQIPTLVLGSATLKPKRERDRGLCVRQVCVGMVARQKKKTDTRAEKRAIEFQQMMARGENPYLTFRKRDEEARRAGILKDLVAGQ
eukprot:741153-Prorocentrum_minimum.AAC.2